jgi:hypothetical protein
MVMPDARKMPSENAIRDYWCSTDLWERMDVPGESDLGERGVCMACGRKSAVGRAHILARNDGGSNEPSNLHMLCMDCHNASELLDGERYWRWFMRQNIFTSCVPMLARHGLSFTKMGRMSIEQVQAAAPFGDRLRKKECTLEEMLHALEGIGIDIRL